jgi:hypothetical protein
MYYLLKFNYINKNKLDIQNYDIIGFFYDRSMAIFQRNFEIYKIESHVLTQEEVFDDPPYWLTNENCVLILNSSSEFKESLYNEQYEAKIYEENKLVKSFTRENLEDKPIDYKFKFDSKESLLPGSIYYDEYILKKEYELENNKKQDIELSIEILSNKKDKLHKLIEDIDQKYLIELKQFFTPPCKTKL